MQTANYESNLINLADLPRERYQQIFEEAKKGKVTCPICGEKIRLSLGIAEPPSFYHILTKNALCKDVVAEPTTNEPDIYYIERNGFRIPTKRVIPASTNSSTDFKPPKKIAPKSIYQAKQDTKPCEFSSPYLNELKSNGVLLDQQQLRAVEQVEGPTLVVSGAGSGKTRVLTARTAYMILEKQIDPKTIMLVTFTAKAAAEMKARLASYPHMHRGTVHSLVAGTFHSIFYRILQFHQPHDWHSSRLIKHEWQKEQILKEAGRKHQLDDKEFAYDLALQRISFWKNTLIRPNEVQAEDAFDEQVLHLYKHYELTKQQQGLFDFDDMLLGCHQLFVEEPSILQMYQNRFRYFLIDEFQDINKVQYQLMKLLSSVNQNICVVGDDDQSIYSFRGSDPSFLLSFEKDYPKATVITLSENYRSTHAVVDAANRVIRTNRNRRPKQMKANSDSPLHPVLFYPFDEEEEATMIVQDIASKMENGYAPSDFAILFRTNTSSRATFERLTNSSLPFRIDNDLESFYERYLVKGILAFLRLAMNGDDQEAIRQALPLLFVKQSVMNDLKANSILSDSSLLECLAKVKTGHSFQERKLHRIPGVVGSIRGLSPVAALERLESELSLQDVIKKRGSEGNKLERGSDDLRDLKVAARNFASIMDFLDHVDHMNAMNKEIKKLSKQLDQAITLSTIHRAKGLEYKVVYLLQAVDGSLPHDYSLEASRNGDSLPLEEERRLMYVAMTRAKEELYMSVPEKRRGKKTNPSRFFQSL